MPKYRYLGASPTAIALPPEKEGDDPKDVQLQPYRDAELPEDHPYVKRMVAQGLLVAIVRTTKAKKEEGDQ